MYYFMVSHRDRTLSKDNRTDVQVTSHTCNERRQVLYGEQSAHQTAHMYLLMAISKTRNGEWRNGERGTGNGERGISKRGNL